MAKSQKLDLSAYVPYFLSAINNAVSRGASRLYLREFGVGIIEWRVMSMLAVEPSIMANRICAVISLDKAAASRSLKILEELGYIASAVSADPRRRSYALTPSGQAMHDRIIQVALQRENRLLAGMSPQDRDHLVRLMRVMLKNVPDVNREDYDLPG